MTLVEPEQRAVGAAAGFRVLEVGSGRALAYTGRLLAGCGAEVIKVDDPGTVSPSEQDPDFCAWLDAGKRRLGPLDGIDQQALERALQGCDMLVTTGDPAFSASLVARAGLPRADLIRVHLSDFGPDGPLASWKGNELILQAMSGFMGFTGRYEDPPVMYGADVAWLVSGAAAALGALVAAWERASSGAGQDVDLAGLDLVTWSQGVFPLLASFTGVIARRNGKVANPDTTIYPARDGELVVVVGRDGWDRVVALLEDPALLDEAFRDPESRQIANRDRTVAALTGHFLQGAKHDWFHRAQALRLPFAPVQDARDVLNCPQLRARGFFESFDGCELPGRPYVSTGAAWRAQSEQAAPAPGVSARVRQPSGGLPLKGVKVVELTTAWSAPLAGKLLADLGAEVIKVESAQHPDLARGGNLTDYAVREEFWDEFGHFLMANTSKAHCCLEFSDERSRAVLKRLIRSADVLIENFPPRVLARAGLDYGVLSLEHPGLIMASTCAFGHTGPWSSYTGMGWTLEGAAGLTHLTGHAGAPAVLSLNPFPDMASALHLAFGVVAALHRRERTGRGEWIELSQYEIGATAAAPALLDLQRTGVVPGRSRNRHPRFAPHNIYPSAPDGTALGAEDNWVAIAVETEDEWAALRGLLGDELLGRERWRSAAGRKADEDALDAAIASWTRTRTAGEVAAQLQAAGLRSAAVARFDQVVRNPQLWHRGFLVRAEHHLIGPRIVTGPVQRFSRTPGRVRWVAPRFAQHNELVWDLLGLSREEQAELYAAGLTSRMPTGLLQPTRGGIPLELQLQAGMARGADPDYQAWNAADPVLPLGEHFDFDWSR